MNVWFTSDTHFGHERVITFDYAVRKRYININEHDDDLIARWNSVVGVRDVVYHLGDFCWSKTVEGINRYIDLLNGKIVLVKGNHDHSNVNSCNFTDVVDYMKLKFDKDILCAMHYPIEEWDRQRYGSIHIHGHTHGKCRKISNRVDCGIDDWDGYPISLEQIKERASAQTDSN